MLNAFFLLLIAFPSGPAAPPDTQAAASNPQPVIAADPVPAPFFHGAVPRTAEIAGDATLRDITGIGNRCWAVGDRGVIVRSEDGGQTWQSAFVSVDCTLRSVCFLTDRIGFVAGHAYSPRTRRSTGVLLTTRDGGDSWQPLAGPATHSLNGATLTGSRLTSQLPPIRTVRFFDLEHGIVVCSGTQDAAGGFVGRTTDGGATWNVVSHEQRPQPTLWLGGEFLSPRNGIVFGHSSASAILVGDRVIDLDQPSRQLRRWHDASLSDSGMAWLAGDNGRLLVSGDQGVTWKPAPLHTSMQDVLDYHSVDQAGNTVCVAGSPGSVVLLSPDAGSSWTLRQLPDSTPVHRIRFINAKTVLAVGAFGKIHRSSDGGHSWKTVRGAHARAALLSLVSHPNDVPAAMLASLAGDQGYRSVVIQLSARLPGPRHDDRLAEQQTQRFCSTLAASQFEFDWLLARTQPLQQLARRELESTWSRQTDGRIDTLLPLRLARLFRTWRPDVVTIDGSSKNDVLQQIWEQQIRQATELAAAAPGSGLLDKIGLAPWRVHRIVVRQHGDVRSTLHFDEDQMLPRLGTTTASIIRAEFPWGSPWTTGSDRRPSRQTYRIVSSDEATANPQHLFSGLNIAPGSAARRKVAIRSNATELQAISRQAQIQKSALKGHLQSSRSPEALIAQIQQSGHGLPPVLQLQQLQFLAERFAELENLEGEIAVLKDIVRRFPQSPAAVDAAETLFLYFSSEELRGLRRRTQQSATRNDRIQQVAGSIPGIPDAGSGVQVAPRVSVPGLERLPNSQGRDKDLITANWDRQAEQYLQFLRQQAAPRADSAKILLRRAANARRTGAHGLQRTMLAEASAAAGPNARLATAELEAVQNVPLPTLPVVRIPATVQRPYLDGQITDECWADAAELPMRSAQASIDDPTCVLLLTWDPEHVYLAARIRLPDQREARQDQTVARRHDADHLDRDRLSVMFDIDRDYTTGFQFTVDEAGQTSERCWRERSWNPKWYVAEMSDPGVWGFEAAIPLDAFGTKLQPGDTWCLQAARIAPGAVSQYLSNANEQASLSSIDGYGLIRFVRAQNKHR